MLEQSPSVDHEDVSKLAVTAFLTSWIPVLATVLVIVASCVIAGDEAEGWERFGNFLFIAVVGQFALIGGTVVAGVAAILGGVAMWRIAKGIGPTRGWSMAAWAIAISMTWATVAWLVVVLTYLLVVVPFENKSKEKFDSGTHSLYDVKR